MLVTFLPPDEPNGNISAYHVSIYREGQFAFHIDRLQVVSNANKSMTAVIEGLKGGFNYSIRVKKRTPMSLCSVMYFFKFV